MGRFRDLTGQKFGRLTCVAFVGRNKEYDALWLCRCACGKEHTTRAGTLLNGHTKSCGCLQREMVGKAHTTHGLYYDENGKRSKLSKAWDSMKRRCLNSKELYYRYYGGRGISICKQWMDYKNFHDWAIKNGYRDGLTIERIDVNGNYEPGNCKWIPKGEQSRNRRGRHIIFYMGQSRMLTEWGNILNIDPKVLSNRLRRGWSVERAFNQSLRRGKSAIKNP